MNPPHPHAAQPHPASGAQVEHRADRVTHPPWPALIVFIAVSFGLAWVIALPLWLAGGPNAANLDVWIATIGIPIMFTPLVAVLIALPLLRLPKGERLRFLGIWPLRPAKRVVWFTVAAIFAPLLLMIALIALAAATGFLTLDLVNFSGFAAQLDAQFASLDPSLATALPPVGLIVLGQLLSIPLGAVINSLFAFGEEIGWRGFLLPALLPLGTWPALLLSGVLWGLWHSPLILLGYNFGLTDWRGVALMVGGCVAWGVLLGWSRLRSASVWPAVFGHGALNAAGGLPLLVMAAGSDFDPAFAGPLGILMWVVLAIVVAVLAITGQLAKQPELAPPVR